MIDIQTFFLCHKLFDSSDGLSYDGKIVGIHTVNPADSSWPLHFTPHMFIQLRRETDDTDETAVVKMKLINEDGKTVTSLKPDTFKRVIPKGNRFSNVTGILNLVLPVEGRYYFELSVANNPIAHPFDYYFDVWVPPKGHREKQAQERKRSFKR